MNWLNLPIKSFLLGIFLLPLSLFAQKESDSLKMIQLEKKLVNTPAGNDKVNLMLEIVELKKFFDWKAADELIEQTLVLAQSLPDTLGIVSCYSYKNRLAVLDGRYKEAADLLKRMRALCKENEQSRANCLALRSEGYYWYHSGNLEEAIPKYKQSVIIAKALEEQKLLSASYNSLGNLHEHFDHKKAIDYYQKGIALEKEYGDVYHLATYYLNIHGPFLDMGMPDSALYYLNLAHAIFKTNKPRSYYYVLGNLANVYQYKGDLAKALDYRMEVLKYFEERKDSFSLSIITLNIGSNYNGLENYEKAIVYLQQSLEISQKIADKDGIASALLHLGSNNLGIGAYQKAQEFLEEALALFLELDYDSRIGETYLALGEGYKLQEKNTLALDYFKKAEFYFEKSESLNELANLYAEVGAVYTDQNEFSTAIPYLEKGRLILEEQESIFELEENYHSLATAYAGQENFAKAYDYYRKYHQIRDSSLSVETNRKIAEIDSRFQLGKKDAEIAAQDLLIARKTNQQNRIIAAALFFFLLIAALFQYFRSQQKIRQKEAQLALQYEKAAASKLRELDQLKSTFFANISHEFRTPLTMIKAPLTGFLSGQFKGETDKYFRIMNRNADRLLQLVNQLLDLSKLESGKMKLQIAEGDIFKFLRAIAYSFESLAIRKQIDFSVNVPTHSMITFFDRDKLEKILTNLLSNAFKFTPEEGKVELSASNEKDTLILQIKDNGIGIPEDQLDTIFERFYHTSNVSDLQASSGIGLALTKELVDLHGGTLKVKSEVDRGTIFSLSLTLGKEQFKEAEVIPVEQEKKPEKLESTIIPEARKIIKSPHDFIKKLERILVVEDNADVRTYIYDQLEGDYEILEAENGKIGLELALEKTPDLIISDVMMPEMNGTELCRLLKTNEKTSHIPVILLTAKAERSDKIEGLETGADDYLTKPFDAEELKVRMHNLIGQRKRLREKFANAGILQAKAITANSVDKLFLEKVMEEIEKNMEDEDFSIVDLAKSLAMSRSQLHRKIKALTNFSPSVFIRILRLERAKQLLEQKAGNASEIGFMVGFNSAAYFTKCFTDHYGFPPSKLLKK